MAETYDIINRLIAFYRSCVGFNTPRYHQKNRYPSVAWAPRQVHPGVLGLCHCLGDGYWNGGAMCMRHL